MCHKIYYNLQHNAMILFIMHDLTKAKCLFIGIYSDNNKTKSLNNILFSVEGKSRSPSIACIYLMTITGISWSDVINSLRGVRTLVDPNFAFQRQLKHFYDQHMVNVNNTCFSYRIKNKLFYLV
jgi:hypothetical protein